MKSKIYFFCFLSFFIFSALPIIIVDPYFHYHKPLSLSYILDNQRSQNDGITKHFDYDGVITGTSMTENFKKTEADKLFNKNFIKVPYSGGSFKEINDNLKVALKYNNNLKIVIRALDMSYFLVDANRMHFGAYPMHLYDNNPFNDVKYIFNKEIFLLVTRIIWRSFCGRKGDDFDRYSYWMWGYEFGKNAALQNIEAFEKPSEIKILTQEEKEICEKNILHNVTSLARAYPDCTFYYFFPPYSAVWWGSKYQCGELEKQIEVEKLVIEQILSCENIKLFSFNTDFDLTTNLNNYKDLIHYGEKINSLILKNMKQTIGLLTKENYLSYLETENSFYSTFDYNSLFDQIDEEDPPCDLK